MNKGPRISVSSENSIHLLQTKTIREENNDFLNIHMPSNRGKTFHVKKRPSIKVVPVEAEEYSESFEDNLK